MANYGCILEGLHLWLIDAARMNWTDTITPDDNQWLEARHRLKLNNFGARGLVNGYAKHVRDNCVALEK